MNNPQTVTVPARAWFGDDDRTLTFPAGWDVHLCASRGAPELGGHTDAVLAEAGFTPEETAALRASGAVA